MKADRLSLALALSSQILFAVLLPIFSWSAAVWGALSIAALSLGMSRGGLPRIQLGSFLCFAAMSALSLAFKGDDLFPCTGLFFACGLGTASLADAILPACTAPSSRALPTSTSASAARWRPPPSISRAAFFSRCGPHGVRNLRSAYPSRSSFPSS